MLLILIRTNCQLCSGETVHLWAHESTVFRLGALSFSPVGNYFGLIGCFWEFLIIFGFLPDDALSDRTSAHISIRDKLPTLALERNGRIHEKDEGAIACDHGCDGKTFSVAEIS